MVFNLLKFKYGKLQLLALDIPGRNLTLTTAMVTAVKEAVGSS